MATNDSTAPGDAFAALGSEPRLAILRTVADAVEAGETGLGFTEIYDRVGDGSTSQVSYHLTRLEGRFLRQVEDTYTLTQAGDRVVRAIRSGAYSETPSFEPTEVEGDCPSCGAATLTAAYRESMLAVACDTCETTVATFDLPPSASNGRTNREVLESCNRRAHHEYSAALQGTCSTCGGTTEVDVRECEGPASYTCVARCTECRLRLFAPLEVRLLYHPGVAAFYWEHGVDVSNVPFWQLPTYVAGWTVDCVGDGALPCEITVVHEGAHLRASVDEALGVTVLES